MKYQKVQYNQALVRHGVDSTDSCQLHVLQLLLHCPQFTVSLQSTILHSGLEKLQVLLQEVLLGFQTLMPQDSCKYLARFASYILI